MFLVKGVPTIVSEENCPPVTVRVWVRVKINFKVGGVFFLVAIVVRTLIKLVTKCFCVLNVIFSS